MNEIKIKNQHIFKNKVQMVIYLILFAFLLYMFIFLGGLNYETKIQDNERFAEEFNLVPEDNVFKYINSQDAKMLITGQDGIILIGHKTDWVNYYAKMVNEVAKDLNISTINYYDILDDRNNDNGTYETIVNYLDGYITYNDLGEGNLYAPTLIIKKNNRIIYFDDETSMVKGKMLPSTYWTEFQINMKKNELETALRKYLES